MAQSQSLDIEMSSTSALQDGGPCMSKCRRLLSLQTTALELGVGRLVAGKGAQLQNRTAKLRDPSGEGYVPALAGTLWLSTCGRYTDPLFLWSVHRSELDGVQLEGLL